MKNQTACFTGHRHIEQNELTEVTQKLETALIELIESGYLYFGSGGALGFDMIAAESVLSLKARYPKIKLILVLPCSNQTAFWSIYEKNRLKKIRALADKVVCLSETYYSGCMQKRNRHLVDNSSACISYLRKNDGGTYYTVEYARKRNLKIIGL